MVLRGLRRSLFQAARSVCLPGLPADVSPGVESPSKLMISETTGAFFCAGFRLFGAKPLSPVLFFPAYVDACAAQSYSGAKWHVVGEKGSKGPERSVPWSNSNHP